ncbi:MAG TPA: Ig-like domain-containing protein [Gemmatimonadaceae bacterium]|nr:Ig-like domain-containing protein [Gemmatimonadaceae bacterium]
MVLLVACTGAERRPVTLHIAPTADSISVNATLGLRAIGSFPDSSSLTMTGVQWRSTNPAAATVNEYGTVVGVSAGKALIVAELKGLRDSVEVTVGSGAAGAHGEGIGPLRVSKANPRYFADPAGRVVYLTGSHYWKNVQDDDVNNPPKPFDNRAYLDFLVRHNHNFTRLWVWEQARWSDEVSYSHWIAPTIYERTGPGVAADGGLKFDVSRFNPAFFARLRQRVVDARARGIYVSVMLFDGWSLEMKPGNAKANPWRAHPFNAANNINGVNGDPNGDASGREVQTLTIPAITALQESYVKAVVDAVNEQDNVLYEISNETDSSAIAWQYHMINVLRAYEAKKPRQHPIGMTVPWPGSNAMVLASPADWVSMNGDASNPPPTNGEKVSLNDTDHLCGICGSIAWVWKSFARGHNPILMDGYDNSPGVSDPAYHPDDPKWETIRRNLGFARSYAQRMDMADARPRGDLSSSGFCLAVPGKEYLVFLPDGGSATLNLNGAPGRKSVEWFDPAAERIYADEMVAGGGVVKLRAPFSGAAIAYVWQ